MGFAGDADGRRTHQNPLRGGLGERHNTKLCKKSSANQDRSRYSRQTKQGTPGMGINSKNTEKTNASASVRHRAHHPLKNFPTRPPRCHPPPNPNLFLYKIQDVLEVEVVVIVSDALLDVGVENCVHLATEKNKNAAHVWKRHWENIAKHDNLFIASVASCYWNKNLTCKLAQACFLRQNSSFLSSQG